MKFVYYFNLNKHSSTATPLPAMKYLYKGALPHQIMFYSLGYQWERNPTQEIFAQDFIQEELCIPPEKIPAAILQTVLRVVVRVVPDERFLQPQPAPRAIRP